MTERIEQQLAQIFDKLFQRQSLQRNIYIFNQMKSNLEIPISLIYKERKVANVTSDQKLILQALKKCDRVVVNDEKKTLQIKLQPAKSRLVVKAPLDDKKTREIVDTLIRDNLGHVDYRIDTDKHSNLLVNMASEAEAEQLLAAVEKHPEHKLNCVLEERDPFQEFKDSIQRIKKQKKDKNQMFNPFDASNNYYQGQAQQWPQQVGMPNMPNMPNVPNMPMGGVPTMPNMPSMLGMPGMANFPYNNFGFGKPQRARGPGYTRRAVQSSDEQQPSEKRPKYRQKQEAPKTMPVSQIQKRTRLNSENFPSLEEEAKVQQKVLKHIYQKKDIVDVFTHMVLATKIQINKDLEKSGIPLLKPEGNFRLEAMKIGGRKESTFDSPKMTYHHAPHIHKDSHKDHKDHPHNKDHHYHLKNDQHKNDHQHKNSDHSNNAPVRKSSN